MNGVVPASLAGAIEARTARLAVVGLGYVGLPLAAEFGKLFPVVGFDINPRRIAELQGGTDRTLELDATALKAATHLTYSSEPQDLRGTDVFIVTVPTTSATPSPTPVAHGDNHRCQSVHCSDDFGRLRRRDGATPLWDAHRRAQKV